MLVKKIRKTLLIVLLVPALPAVFVTPAVAQEAPPKLQSDCFVHYQGRYSIVFPRTRAGQRAIGVEGMTADADIDGAGFIVVCEDMHPTSNVDKFFDEVEAVAVSRNHARTVRRVAITLGSVQGREVELENETGWQRISRHYRRGNRYFQVVVQARGRQLNRQLAQAFLDSFKLLEGNPPEPTMMPSPAPAAQTAPAASEAPSDLPDIAPPPPVAVPARGRAPLSVREEIVRMMHGTNYEDLRSE